MRSQRKLLRMIQAKKVTVKAIRILIIYHRSKSKKYKSISQRREIIKLLNQTEVENHKVQMMTMKKKVKITKEVKMKMMTRKTAIWMNLRRRESKGLKRE